MPGMGNRKRLEILLIFSILANCSFLVFQIFKVDNDTKLKSRIEILRTLGSYGNDAKGFRHNVLLDESFQISERKDFKRIQATAGKVLSTTNSKRKFTTPKEEDNDALLTNVRLQTRPKPSLANASLNQFCKEGGEKLEGLKKVNVKELTENVHLLDTLSVTNGGSVEFGGWWEPSHCKPRVKVAIMLPYRNRELQLQAFLMHMHPIFQRQLLAYRIFVVEQVGVTAWNKGSIYNIGFEKTQKIDNFDCYIFHDIDLLAENDKNFYGCPFTPAHMSVAVDTLKYKLPYNSIFGGVEAFSAEEYRTINGFSNMYWGWGGEDDDLYTRVVQKGYKLYRPPAEIGRYTMNKLNHFRSNGMNNQNQKMYHDGKTRKKRIDVDGLNKVSTLRYTCRVTEEALFTRIAIDLERSRVLNV